LLADGDRLTKCADPLAGIDIPRLSQETGIGWSKGSEWPRISVSSVEKHGSNFFAGQ
jgi:hypothetical protein